LTGRVHENLQKNSGVSPDDPAKLPRQSEDDVKIRNRQKLTDSGGKPILPLPGMAEGA